MFGINRLLRIYPGFIVCVVAIALLLGPLGSSVGWRDYFRSPEVLRYFANAISCLCDFGGLPGVYGEAEANGLGTVVNGSLWSLKFEVLSYVLLLWLWLAFRKVQSVGIALIVLAAASAAVPAIYKSLPGVTYTLPYFASGVVMYVVYERIGFNAYVAVAAAAILLIAAALGFPRIGFVVFGGYVVTFLGSRPNIGSALAARIGDLSYGVYLFGWPIEQLVKHYTQTSNPWVLMAVSAPFILATAAMSWHLVEGPALRLRQPIAQFVSRVLAMSDPLRQRASHLCATLAFLGVAAAILTSETHWWFVTRSLAELAVASGIGASLGLVIWNARRLWLWRPAD